MSLQLEVCTEDDKLLIQMISRQYGVFISGELTLSLLEVLENQDTLGGGSI